MARKFAFSCSRVNIKNVPLTSTVGRYVVDSLFANGIDVVFGIPGVHTLELYRGLAQARMRHVLVRHEQNEAFAADGYARVTGRPAAGSRCSKPSRARTPRAPARR